MKIKLIACLLMLCTVLSAFTGCFGKEQTDEQTNDTAADSNTSTDEATVDTEIKPDFEEVNFDCDINMLQRDGAVREEWDPEAESNTIMKHALAEKVNYMEEKYGVSFQLYSVHVSEIKQVAVSIQTESSYYHIMTLPHMHMSSLASQGLLRDIAAIENVDLEKPWWSQQINRELDYKGSLYFATGNSNLCSMWYTCAVFFNKDMAKSLGYSLSEIYASVENHTWTAEKMISMSNEVYLDADGIQGPTDGDRFGISQTAAWYPVFYGAGLKLVTKDSEGRFLAAPIDEKMVDVITSIINYQNDGDNSVPLSSGINQWGIFSAGNALFLMDGIAYVNSGKKSSVDYGILPCPLGEAGQETYYNFVHAGHDSAFAVPSDTYEEDLPMLGIILEESNYISRREVWPEFFNTLMKGQLAKDPESAAALDVIFNNLTIDAMMIYGGHYDEEIRKMISNNNYTGVKSTLEGLQPSVQTNLDQYNDAYDALR